MIPQSIEPTHTKDRCQRARDTRALILDTALVAFAELGFDGASTREVAARSGVNQGLISYYFGNKEKLWKESVDRVFEQMSAELCTVNTTGEEAMKRSFLKDQLRRFMRFTARHPELLHLINDEGKRHGPRMEWLVDNHVKPLQEGIMVLCEFQKELGYLPKSVDAIHFYYILVGAASMLFQLAPEFERVTGKNPRHDAVIEQHIDALAAMMGLDEDLG